MRRCLRAALARLVDARKRGTSLVLLFDYDGTLVPIADHPNLAVLSSETRYRLERLALTPAIFIGVLSGRAIGDLRRLVGIDDAYYAGTSGLEVSLRHSTVLQPDVTHAAPQIAAVVAPVRQALTGYSGAWVEQKPLGLTVHYRHVMPSRIEALRVELAGIVRAFPGTLRTLDSAMAIEIVPDLGWTKGTALRMIVEHVRGAPVLPLYAGDDTNDADALLAAADLGGVAIGIGDHAPRTAQYRLPDPLSLGCGLDALLEMLIDDRTVESGPAAPA